MTVADKEPLLRTLPPEPETRVCRSDTDDSNADGDARPADQLPRVIGVLSMAAYLWMMAVFALVFWADAEVRMVLVIGVAFILMYFGVPAILVRMGKPAGSPAEIGPRDVLRRGLQTFTGFCDGTAALVQILLVPACLAGGVTVMGIIIAATR